MTQEQDGAEEPRNLPADREYVAALMRVTNDLAVAQRQLAQANRALREEMRARALAEARAAAVDRLESLTTMAAGLAHHLNNALTSISGYTTLALEQLPKELHEIVYCLRAALESSERAATISRALWDFTGHGVLDLCSVDLMPLLEDAIAKAPPGVELYRASPLSQVEVLADPRSVLRCLDELIRNALEASGSSEEGARVSVWVRVLAPAEDTGGRFVLVPERPERPYFQIEVRDAGHGMDASVAARAFDPFFTTGFQGRGLGLAYVFGAMRGHEGGISLETAPGRGTRIALWFPLAEGS